MKVSAWASWYGATNRYFWTSDITTMSRQLEEYKENVRLRRPGAKKALKDFRAQQIEMLTSVREVSSIPTTTVDVC